MRRLCEFGKKTGEHDDPRWGWDSKKPYVGPRGGRNQQEGAPNRERPKRVSDQTKPTKPRGGLTLPLPPPGQSVVSPRSVLASPKPQGRGEAQIKEAKAGLAPGLPAVRTESLGEGTCSSCFPSAHFVLTSARAHELGSRYFRVSESSMWTAPH